MKNNHIKHLPLLYLMLVWDISFVVKNGGKIWVLQMFFFFFPFFSLEASLCGQSLPIFVTLWPLSVSRTHSQVRGQTVGQLQWTD